MAQTRGLSRQKLPLNVYSAFPTPEANFQPIKNAYFTDQALGPSYFCGAHPSWSCFLQKINQMSLQEQPQVFFCPHPSLFFTRRLPCPSIAVSKKSLDLPICNLNKKRKKMHLSQQCYLKKKKNFQSL